MLDETDLAVQEIAVQIGYENPLNFSRGFKHVYGISPTEYRRAEKPVDIVADSLKNER